MPEKKTSGEVKEKTYTLSINVKPVGGAAFAEEIYVVGNIQKLGEWEPKKAKALKTADGDKYTVNVTGLSMGTEVEFKVLCAKSWDKVEKGANFEEIQNHVVTVNGKTVVDVEVYNWA